MKNSELKKSEMISTFVVAAGGNGKRIHSYFKSIGFNNSKVLFQINRKPLIKYLLDMALILHFEKIFILTSFYEKEITNFINKNYKSNRNIKLIYGNKKGKIKGVPYMISLLKKELKEPFIYSDGNIIYDIRLLKRISTGNILKKSIINIIISDKDLAPTHLRVFLSQNKISEVEIRYDDNFNKNYNFRLSNLNKSFCSIGLMVISNSIFNSLPELKKMGDFDFVIKYLFRKSNEEFNPIDFTKYKGKWFCLHNKEDIDKICKKE